MSRNKQKMKMSDLDFKDDRYIDKKLKPTAKMPAKVRKMIREAKKFQKDENWPEVVRCMNVAWEYDPENLDILMVLAYALGKLGARDKALDVIQHMLSVHEPNIVICQIMGLLAIEMGMDEVGVKIWRIVLQFDPTQLDGYVNLITCLKNMGNHEEAIDTAQQVLPIYPECAAIWNALGSAVTVRDGNEASLVFYREALRLEPDNYLFLSNISNVTEDIDERIAFSRKSIALNPDFPEARLGLGLDLMTKGELEEAFELYEARRDAKRKVGQTVLYAHKYPMWQGEPLEGKTILVMNEQGIGDEVIFATNYPRLIKEAGKVILTSDHRLQGLLERSFPEVDVYKSYDGVSHGYAIRYYKELQENVDAGEEHIDYAISLASIPRYYWKTKEDVPSLPVPLLKPEPSLATKWAERVASAGDKNLKVGISWASGVSKDRSKALYLTIDDLAPILTMPGIDFYNVQYANIEEGLREAKDKYGVTIHHWNDFEVKKDIEANIALMSNLDLVIGPLAAPQSFAAAAGTNVWWLSASEPWWLFASSPEKPSIYSKGRMFCKKVAKGSWEETIKLAKGHLEEMVKANASGYLG